MRFTFKSFLFVCLCFSLLLKTKTVIGQQADCFIIDESNAKIIPATCNQDNGGIEGLTINALGLVYSWTDENNIIVSSNFRLDKAKPGKYQLTVTKGNCIRKSAVYEIFRVNPEQFPDYQTSIIPSTCNLNNGVIRLNFSTGIIPTAIRWINENNAVIGTSNNITGLSPGDYQLYLTDQSGCERLYKQYIIEKIQSLEVDVNAVKIQADKCGLGTGSITGITASSSTILTYNWINEQNEIVSNAIELLNAKAGSYKLQVTDGLNSACSTFFSEFIIPREASSIPKPLFQNLNICSPGTTTISVPNPSPGKYTLYLNEFTAIPLQINDSGVFNVNISANAKFYISYNDGTCESDRSLIEIKIDDPNVIIANAFSPNGDGRNDTWMINNIQNYPRSSLKIYNRNGNQVYSGTGSSRPFDGYRNGHILPVGIYYYHLILREGCKSYTGSVTLIR